MNKKAYIIHMTTPLTDNAHNVFHYNVQLWNQSEEGAYYYCGEGRFCHNLAEAEDYAARNASTIERHGDIVRSEYYSKHLPAIMAFRDFIEHLHPDPTSSACVYLDDVVYYLDSMEISLSKMMSQLD